MSAGVIIGMLATNNIVALAAAAACFATIVTLAGPVFRNRRYDERLKGVASHRERLRQRSREQLFRDKQQKRGLRNTPRGFVRKVVERFQLQKLLADPAVNDKLIQAGFRGERPVFVFYFARAAAPIAMFLFALFYLFLVNDLDKSGMTRLTIAVGA
ncbi:MAG: type II secretion system F family protein, partial [Caulobacterales bacterium]|nr:type II secretion system F family protein [Caulobacterales bacterium]